MLNDQLPHPLWVESVCHSTRRASLQIFLQLIAQACEYRENQLKWNRMWRQRRYRFKIFSYSTFRSHWWNKSRAEIILESRFYPLFICTVKIHNTSIRWINQITKNCFCTTRTVLLQNYSRRLLQLTALPQQVNFISLIFRVSNFAFSRTEFFPEISDHWKQLNNFLKQFTLPQFRLFQLRQDIVLVVDNETSKWVHVLIGLRKTDKKSFLTVLFS